MHLGIMAFFVLLMASEFELHVVLSLVVWLWAYMQIIVISDSRFL